LASEFAQHLPAETKRKAATYVCEEIFNNFEPGELDYGLEIARLYDVDLTQMTWSDVYGAVLYTAINPDGVDEKIVQDAQRIIDAFGLSEEQQAMHRQDVMGVCEELVNSIDDEGYIKRLRVASDYFGIPISQETLENLIDRNIFDPRRRIEIRRDEVETKTAERIYLKHIKAGQIYPALTVRERFLDDKVDQRLWAENIHTYAWGGVIDTLGESVGEDGIIGIFVHRLFNRGGGNYDHEKKILTKFQPDKSKLTEKVMEKLGELIDNEQGRLGHVRNRYNRYVKSGFINRAQGEKYIGDMYKQRIEDRDFLKAAYLARHFLDDMNMAKQLAEQALENGNYNAHRAAAIRCSFGLNK